jgi:hypothetical protein
LAVAISLAWKRLEHAMVLLLENGEIGHASIEVSGEIGLALSSVCPSASRHKLSILYMGWPDIGTSS